MKIPILWRYLLGQYVRVLILSTFAFVAVLLIMRLDEIARFATLGATIGALGWFVLHQIPYILPVAIPFSCLIAATLLIQRLSQSYELTALRASGMAFRDLLSPILIAAVWISLLNFYIVSEIATDSHLTSGIFKSELRAVNPLLLAHNKHLMRLKGFYFDTYGPSRMGESASDVLLAMPSRNGNRLNVLVAKDMQAALETFTGHKVTLISSLGEESEDYFDQLMLENIGNASTSVEDFSQIMQKKIWTPNNDHLRLSLLMVRIEEEHRAIEKAQQDKVPESDLKLYTRSINRGYSEIIRRLSIALAVFTFTLMGASFGVSISRNRSNRGVFVVIVLSATYLVSYFAAKGMDHVLITAMLLYMVPHILIIGLSLWTLRRAACGIE